eukprot:4897637-Alexandrium_andersonii.AAC.1
MVDEAKAFCIIMPCIPQCFFPAQHYGARTLRQRIAYRKATEHGDPIPDLGQGTGDERRQCGKEVVQRKGNSVFAWIAARPTSPGDAR